MHPTDRVVDYDALCRELGSRSRYDHPPRIRHLADSMRRSLEERAAAGSGRTWVIRSLPKAEDRAAAAKRLGARVVVLPTPAEEAIARASSDDRPTWTEGVIRDWWRDYTPSETDEEPTSDSWSADGSLKSYLTPPSDSRTANPAIRCFAVPARRRHGFLEGTTPYGRGRDVRRAGQRHG